MSDRDISKTLALYFYATSPYTCSYLPEQKARSQVVLPSLAVDVTMYSQLVRLGFRRSGMHIYRPYCDNCRRCISVRIPVKVFQPNRSQRRIYQRLANVLTVRYLPLEYYPEHYQLYCRYQLKRHLGGTMAQDSPANYSEFILKSQVESFLAEFRLGGVVRMVSLIDRLDDGLSAVYTFYDPDEPKASYGVFNILWQINYAYEQGLSYLYLGYWIKECKKMSYKSLYQPLEQWQGGQWSVVPKG